MVDGLILLGWENFLAIACGVFELGAGTLNLNGIAEKIESLPKLERAVYRHQKGKRNRGQSLDEKAAGLLYDFCHLSPFEKRNREVAVASTLMFLDLNRADLQASSEELLAILDAVPRRARYGEVLDWISARIVGRS